MAKAIYQIFVSAFGGLDAIADRLGHIQSLGADAVYLTPIFRAPSPHKYDTADFDAVDEGFGGEAAFERLVAAGRERHVALTIDGVFNHVGDQHLWAREKRFLRGTFWRGHSSLPELDLADPGLRRELFGPDGVVARWTRRGVGGWRLDCANDLGPEICELARKAAYDAGAQCVIGELMGHPSDESGVDGCMNYWLRSAALAWAAGAPASQVQEALDRLTREVAPSFLARSWNLISSHDTPRIATLLDGDAARIRQAMALSVAYPGVPMIYYGEEIGMRGGADPANRAPMTWDQSQWDGERLAWMKKLLQLRREEPALEGPYVAMPQPGLDLLCFARVTTNPSETLIFVMNRTAQTARLFVPLPWMHDAVPLTDLLSGDEVHMEAGTLLLKLPAHGVTLLKPHDDHASGYRFWK